MPGIADRLSSSMFTKINIQLAPCKLIVCKSIRFVIRKAITIISHVLMSIDTQMLETNVKRSRTGPLYLIMMLSSSNKSIHWLFYSNR